MPVGTDVCIGPDVWVTQSCLEVVLLSFCHCDTDDSPSQERSLHTQQREVQSIPPTHTQKKWDESGVSALCRYVGFMKVRAISQGHFRMGQWAWMDLNKRNANSQISRRPVARWGRGNLINPLNRNQPGGSIMGECLAKTGAPERLTEKVMKCSNSSWGGSSRGAITQGSKWRPHTSRPGAAAAGH